MIDDNVKNLLKKLFAVADNDASTEGEIDNAMRAAKILMAKHQIEREDVIGNGDDVDTSKVSYSLSRRYSLYTAMTQWESYVCNFITDFVAGTGFYIQKNVRVVAGNRRTVINFYGPEDDVRFCCELFDEIVLFIQSAACIRYGSALSRGQAAAYAEGFACGLYASNKRESERLVKTSDSTALVVVNRSMAILDGGKDWLRKEHAVKLTKGRSNRSAANKNWKAYLQGKADGESYKPGASRMKKLA